MRIAMTFRIDQGTLGSVVVGKIMDVATSVEVVRRELDSKLRWGVAHAAICVDVR